MDYNSLSSQIASYANRNEPAFLAAIPDIINQAMSRIYSEAKTLGFQKTTNGTFATGIPTIIKPFDYKETISFQYTDPVTLVTTFLLARSYEFCVTYSPVIIDVAPPVFYSADTNVPQQQVGPSTLYLSPTPDANYNYSLTYLSFPPQFDATAPRNFLTDRYPNLLLYACMVEAIPYLKSDERIPVFESLYNRALQGVSKDTKGRYTDRISTRDKD